MLASTRKGSAEGLHETNPSKPDRFAGVRDLARHMEKERLVKDAKQSAEKREQLWMHLAMGGCIFAVSSAVLPPQYTGCVLVCIVAFLSRHLSTVMPEMKQLVEQKLQKGHLYVTDKLHALWAPIERFALKVLREFTWFVSFLHDVYRVAKLAVYAAVDKGRAAYRSLRNAAHTLRNAVLATPGMLYRLPSKIMIGAVKAFAVAEDTMWDLIERDYHWVVLKGGIRLFEFAVVLDIVLPFDVAGPTHKSIRDAVQAQLHTVVSDPVAWGLDHKPPLLALATFLGLYFNPTAVARRKGRRPQPWFSL